MPRFWVTLALLSWGGFTDNLAGAFVMALMLEAIGFTSIKWAMADREFHRAADLTSVVFALVTAIQFSRYSVHGIYEILRVAPYCMCQWQPETAHLWQLKTAHFWAGHWGADVLLFIRPNRHLGSGGHLATSSRRSSVAGRNRS